MNQEPAKQTLAMPKLLETLLTNKVPCAFLVLMMLTSAYWLNALFGSVPLLGFLALLLGSLLLMAVPTVFAVVLFGGGLSFSLQVGGIAGLAILLLSSGSIGITLVFLVLFMVLPVLAASQMQLSNGFDRASWFLALGLLIFTMFAMWLVADTGLKDLMLQMLAPMFNDMLAAVPAGETEALLSIAELRDVLVLILPGFLVFSIWLTWWGDILFARKIAKKYAFYRGDERTMLDIRLPPNIAYALIVAAALANMASGDVQYVAMNALLVLAGLLAVQGVAVVHVWLKSREMMNTIVVMYVMLFFWSVVVLFFMIVGLFDIWFNYRRNIVSAIGEK